MRARQAGGYGLFAWPCEPFARVEREGASPLFDRPIDDATWAGLEKAGYRSELHLQIEGIPWIMSQSLLRDVAGRLLQAPRDYSVAPSLIIDEADETSCDTDREAGLAAGRAIEFKLDYQALSDYGVLGALFKTPTVSQPLTSSITSATTSSFPLAATTGMVAGTGYYLGHEYIIPSSVDTLSLEGVRRGVCGRPHYHTSEVGVGYRYVTNAPTFWRRRLVTLWEVLVSPEGRALGGSYATIGPYVRQAWRGFIDADEPRTVAEGFELRCLPFERLLAEEMGVKLTGSINLDSQGFPYPMAITAEDAIRIRELGGSFADGVGPNNPGNLYLSSLQTWCAVLANNLEGDFGGGDIVQVRADAERWAIEIVCIFSGMTSHAFDVYPSGCWFLPMNNFTATNGDARARCWVPLQMNRTGCWIAVKFDLSADSQLWDLPSKGMGVLEVDGQREMVMWDEVRQSSSWGPMVALRLSGRGVGGTERVDWTRGGTFAVVCGASGSWHEILLTLATSSGLLGARGVYDTLPVGFGLGLAQEDFDEETLARIDSPEFDVFSDEKTSIDKLLGGWAALQRKCIVQRRGDDGKVRIALVSTEPSNDTTAATLAAGDVLIDGHEVPVKVPAPTRVLIKAGLGSNTKTYSVNGRAVAQSRGMTSWEFRVPGIMEAEAIAYGTSLMRIAEGQSTVSLALPPWSTLQPGDAVDLRTAHPLVYDWLNATRGPSSAIARVVGVGRRLAGAKRATLLLAGQTGQSYMLAPAPIIRHIDAGDRSLFRIDRRQAQWFAANDPVHIYNPGGEAASQFQDSTIVSVTLGETEAVIDLNAVLGSWAVAGTTRMTIAGSIGSATARQLGFMFVDATRLWG